MFLRAALLFSLGILHFLKKFAPRLGKKGSRPGGSPNSLGKNEHSEKALWPRENHTFEGGSTVSSRKKCTFSSGPFLSFRHFPLFSKESVHSGVPFLAALQYSFGKSAHSRSFSFIVFHSLSFSFILFILKILSVVRSVLVPCLNLLCSVCPVGRSGRLSW